MLIDASHEEETRVAIVHGNRVEEFDYESSAKKQIKGNVYLAKITRVEPSLQAAFVEYGGNRHGFLAFSEIHPDYYQIPVSDREKLIAEEAAAYASLLEKEEEIVEKKSGRKAKTSRKKKKSDTSVEESAEENKPDDDDASQSVTIAENIAEPESVSEPLPDSDAPDEEDDGEDNGNSPEEEVEEEAEEDNETETAGSDIIDDEEAEERLRIKIAKGLRRKYKIQEVIKKNQILLVQVVKEERGNKGAALTTYLSLPGRYCVLMPNTLHGGGVSRKIANMGERKSLKKILADLNMPGGIACIIRTAGQSRTKTEIKRDFDYLIRTWEGIRERTLKSVAPVLINEEGDLIKRSLRDLYTREVEEILVEGEKGYKTARSFMRLLMPSHARKIKHYTDDIPLLHRYQVESQLDSMYSPIVQLRSGGYIVINPTEALVSIDVNSGKATKEHNIEETARKTNLEAAEEVARQLRLRDMAGLIVIDFIDMEVRANNRAVEQKMKECLKSDRARIQIGKISSFGLMEMSRQRLRAGVLESSTKTCPHCEGSGVIRSVESQVLHILRALEEEGIKGGNDRVTLYIPEQTAIYMLNHKRGKLVDLEKLYNFTIEIAIDSSLTEVAYRLDLPNAASKKPEKQGRRSSAGQQSDNGQKKTGRERPANARRNRQRNQSRRNKETTTDKPEDNKENQAPSGDPKDSTQEISASENQESKPRRRRRRPRRGNKNQPDGIDSGDSGVSDSVSPDENSPAPDSQNTGPDDQDAKKEQKPARRPYPPQARGRRKTSETAAKPATAKTDKEVSAAPVTPRESKTEKTPPAKIDTVKTDTVKSGPKKTGWWQRTFG